MGQDLTAIGTYKYRKYSKLTKVSPADWSKEYRKGLIAHSVECFVNSYFKGDIGYMHTIPKRMEPINTLGGLLHGVKEYWGEDWVPFATKLIDEDAGRWY